MEFRACRHHLYRQARNPAFLSMCTQVLVIMLGIITGVLTARILSPSERGLLSAYLLMPGILGSLFHFGVPQSAMYFVSLRPEKGTFLSAAIAVCVAQSIVGSIIFACIVLFVPLGQQSRVDVALICALSPGMLWAPYGYALLRGVKEFGFANIVQIVSAVGYMISLLILWRTDTASSLTIAMASVLVPAFAAIFGLAKITSVHSLGALSWLVCKDMIRKGLTFFGPTLAFVIFLSIDRPLILSFAPLEWLGLYAVAMSIAQPLFAVPDAISQVAFVKMVSPESEANSVLITHLQFTLLLCLTLSGFAIILAPPLLHFLFGARYDGAAQIANFVIPAMAMTGFNRMVDSLLRAQGWELTSVSAWSIGAATIACGALLASSTGQTQLFLVSMLAAQFVVGAILLNTLIRAFELKITDLFSITYWRQINA